MSLNDTERAIIACALKVKLNKPFEFTNIPRYANHIEFLYLVAISKQFQSYFWTHNCCHSGPYMELVEFKIKKALTIHYN